MRIVNLVVPGVVRTRMSAVRSVVKSPVLVPASRHVILAVSTFILYSLSYRLSLAFGVFVPVFPVSGLELAYTFLFGYRFIPAFTAGLAVFSITLGLPPSTVIGLGVGDAFAVFLSSYAMKEVTRFRPRMDRLQDVQGLMVFGVLVYTFIVISFGSLSLYSGGIDPFTGYAAPFKIAVFSIILGIVLFSPLVFSWYRTHTVRRYIRRAPEFLAVTLTMASSAAFSFMYFPEYRFVVFLFVIWSALRFPIRAVVVMNLVTATVTLAGILSMHPGRTNMTYLGINTAYYQLFFSSVAISSLIITAMKEEMITAKDRLLRAGEELRIQVKHRTASLTSANSELMREISRRRLIESELRESEDRFRLITEHARDLICIIDSGERFSYINGSVGDMLGWDAAELHRQPVRTIVHADDTGDIRKWSGIKLKQMRLKKRDGTYIWTESEFYPVLLRSKPYVVMMARDISARKALEQRKDEFLSIASHELRTPLTSIKGYTQILERMMESAANPKAVLYARKVDSHIDKLNMLISDLLDVSKIQAGKLQFRFEPIDFDAFSTECVRNARMATGTHEIVLSGHSGAIVLGDRQRLEQVFSNLLSNAVKYSPGARDVTVRLGVSGGQVSLSVTDYGVGIPQAKLGKIFERYYRVDGTAEQFSGLGIGLYITAEIVRRHNGKIAVESHEGKGSTFTCMFPVMH